MEELEKELNSNIQTESEIKPSETTQNNLDSLPRFDDLIKSEKQVKINQEIKGLEQVKSSVQTEDRMFAKKQDYKQAHIKRRIKTITGVYVAVASLLAVFVGVNLVTLAVLNNQKTTNTNTMQSKQELVEKIKTEDNLTASGDDIFVTITEPRGYSDDKKELTVFDKITIFFRHLFG